MVAISRVARSSLRRAAWIALLFLSTKASAQAFDGSQAPTPPPPPVTANAPVASTGQAIASDLAPSSAEAPAPTPPPTAAPEPMTGTWDWVRMNSGEWLRGSIKSLRDGVFLFDSEKFGDQTLDWDDVVEFYSPNPHRYVRNFTDTAVGPAHIVGDDVVIQTESGEVHAQRSELTAILPGRERELSRWSAHLALTFNGNWGASRQQSFGTIAWALREDARTRTRFDYTANVGHSNGVLNVNNMWGNGRFDYFLTRRFFVTPVFGQVGYNKFLNLGLRAYVGSGLGLKLVDRPKFEWDVSAGVVYLFTRYVSVLPPATNPRNDAAVILGTAMHFKITNDIKLHLAHTSMLVPTFFDLTQFDTQAIFSMHVWKHLDLDVTFKHTRIRHPAVQSDGVAPDRDQFTLLVGLGVDL